MLTSLPMRASSSGAAACCAAPCFALKCTSSFGPGASTCWIVPHNCIRVKTACRGEQAGLVQTARAPAGTHTGWNDFTVGHTAMRWAMGMGAPLTNCCLSKELSPAAPCLLFSSCIWTAVETAAVGLFLCCLSVFFLLMMFGLQMMRVVMVALQPRSLKDRHSATAAAGQIQTPDHCWNRPFRRGPAASHAHQQTYFCS